MLDIRALSYTYPGAAQASLTEITLESTADVVFGLLGPNGAGKTTLISVLAGLIQPDHGEVHLDGQPLGSVRRKNPRAIALVPQDYAFYPMLTVRENLSLFAGLLGFRGVECAARVTSCSHFAHLDSVLEQRPEYLSGGIRRRLNLAIGLLGQPRLLLLDEPTVGVDPQSRRFLLESIAALPAQGTTVIYTSHYMEEVQAICRDVAILDQGRVLLAGDMADLLAGDESVFELAGNVRLSAELVARHQVQVGIAGEYRCALSQAGLAALLTDLTTAGLTVRRFSHGQRDLEQVFMQLTRRSLRD